MAARFYALDGIASARDFFVVDSISYIVMEYVEGESLKKYVRNYGTMKGEDILTKLKPVIESLCVIHKEGIIHRDISPDNLMMTKGGSIQLIDFGEARNFEEQRNKELTLVYKRGYAPIEQCRQRGKQGAFTDVYSLCATIYFAVTGIDPDDSVERMIADHMKPLHEFYGTGLSEHEIHVIERGLSVDAKDRFQTMDELFEMLYEKKDLSYNSYVDACGDFNSVCGLRRRFGFAEREFRRGQNNNSAGYRSADGIQCKKGGLRNYRPTFQIQYI